MKNIFKPAIVLIFTIGISISGVIHVRSLTYQYIVKQEVEKRNKTLQNVLPGYTITQERIVTLDDGERFTFWEGIKIIDGIEKRGYAFITLSYGYNNDIKTFAGVDEDNRILGLSIIQQTETPGLDVRLTENLQKVNGWGFIPGKIFSRDQIAEPGFYGQFQGTDLSKKIFILNNGYRLKTSNEELLNRNAIIAVTGATGSIRSLTDNLKAGFMKLTKARLLIKQSEIQNQKKEDAR